MSGVWFPDCDLETKPATSWFCWEHSCVRAVLPIWPLQLNSASTFCPGWLQKDLLVLLSHSPSLHQILHVWDAWSCVLLQWYCCDMTAVNCWPYFVWYASQLLHTCTSPILWFQNTRHNKTALMASSVNDMTWHDRKPVSFKQSFRYH